MKQLLKEVRKWAKDNGHYVTGAVNKVKTYEQYNVCDLNFETVIDRIIKSKTNFSRSATKNKMIWDYGEIEGNKRWKQYCDRQAITNTKEYKMKHHNMTSDEVDEYNKSRSPTLINFIKRYGEIEGNKRWKQYCDRQAYVGCSLDYFIDTYGEIDGREKYKKLNKKKAITYDNFVLKYGDKALEHFILYINKKNINYRSKEANEFFNYVNSILTEEERSHSYLEYCVSNGNEIYFYDFVNTQLKICIEYNGSIWHANPEKYHFTDTPLKSFGNFKTSEEIWAYDKNKTDFIIKHRDISEVIIIWDSNGSKYDLIKRKIDDIRNNRRL